MVRIGPSEPRRALRGFVVVLAAFGLVSGCSEPASRPASTSGPSGPAKTIWQQITTHTDARGNLTKDAALQAFAYLFKVAVPGVVLPAGLDGHDGPWEANPAFDALAAHWDELTAAQQKLVAQYANPGRNDTVLHLNLQQWAGGAGRARPGGFAELQNCLTSTSGAIGSLPVAVCMEVLGDLTRIGSRLGLPAITPSGFGLGDLTIDFSAQDGGNTLMETNIRGGWVTFAGKNVYPLSNLCNITIYSNALANGNGTLNSGSVNSVLHVLLTHEVVHCFQEQVVRDAVGADKAVGVSSALLKFMTEGTATWAATNDAGYGEPGTGSFWKQGFFGLPSRPLTGRDYDAVGYFALLDHLGRGLWAKLAAAWRAAAKAGGGDAGTTAFLTVLDGDAADVQRAWGPWMVNRAAWGDPWVASGVGMEGATVPIASVMPRAPGISVTVPARANTVWSATGADGEIVVVDSPDGLASVHDEAGASEVGFHSDQFCVGAAGCVCPEGTSRAGENVAPTKLTMPFVVTVTSSAQPAPYTLVAQSLEEACGKTTPTTGGAARSPCATGCGGDNGDPHLLTVDGTRYDFQAAGEFTLLRTPDGSIAIQARQEPFGGASINTAAAVRSGGHRIGVYLEGATLVLRVDGAVRSLADASNIAGAARVTPYRRGLRLDLPDGTVVWFISVGIWGVNIEVLPSAALRSTGSGLLAKHVETGFGLPAMPDGTAIPRPASVDERYVLLYQRYADAWRITAADSAFDYPAGKSAVDLQKPGFPAKDLPGSVAEIPSGASSAAITACLAVTDVPSRDECVYDVAVTGDSGFAKQAEATSLFFSEGERTLNAAITDLGKQTATPSSSAPGSTTTSTTTAPTSTLTPVRTDVAEVDGQAIGDDGTLYLSIRRTDGPFELIVVNPRSGAVARELTTPGPVYLYFVGGSLWVAGLGGSTDCGISRLDASRLAVAATFARTCGAFGLRPEHFIAGGGAIWFNDTGADALRRLDATSAQPESGGVKGGGGSGGSFAGSSTAVFHLAPGGVTRTGAGHTAADQLPSLGRLGQFVAGDGYWYQDGVVAKFVDTADGTARKTVAFMGGADERLVAADDAAVYSVRPGASRADPATLWRYSVDGGGPSQIGTGPGGKILLDLVPAFLPSPGLLSNPHVLVYWWKPAAKLYVTSYATGA